MSTFDLRARYLLLNRTYCAFPIGRLSGSRVKQPESDTHSAVSRHIRSTLLLLNPFDIHNTAQIASKRPTTRAFVSTNNSFRSQFLNISNRKRGNQDKF